MKISTNIVFRKDKLNKQDAAPVHIRLILSRKTRYVSTGVTVNVNDWDFDNNEIKRDAMNSVKYYHYDSWNYSVDEGTAMGSAITLKIGYLF